MTSSDAYIAGKKHYFEGLPASAMDHAERGHRIDWLIGWLDAKLEHRFINRSSSAENDKRSNV